jgi:hypothetical protein
VANLLALVVLAALAASLALFYISIVRHGRYQQRVGFLWAALGLLVYVLTFGDRFWLSSFHSGLAPLMVYAGKQDTHFVSPLWVLILLLVLYLVRGVVFRSFYDPLMGSDFHESHELNDFVAPLLSFVAFAVILDTALVEVYRLSLFWAVICVILTLAAYGLPTVVQMLIPWLEVVRSWVIEGFLRVQFYVFLMALQIYRFERWRRRLPYASWDARIQELRDRTARRVEEQRARRAENISRAVDSGPRIRRPRARFGYQNPNER